MDVAGVDALRKINEVYFSYLATLLGRGRVSDEAE